MVGDKFAEIPRESAGVEERNASLQLALATIPESTLQAIADHVYKKRQHEYTVALESVNFQSIGSALKDSVDEQFRSAADAIEFEKAKEVQEKFDLPPVVANPTNILSFLGLTALDVFAMAAMWLYSGSLDNNQIAENSYDLAEAMLAEKKRREGK